MQTTSKPWFASAISVVILFSMTIGQAAKRVPIAPPSPDAQNATPASPARTPDKPPPSQPRKRLYGGGMYFSITPARLQQLSGKPTIAAMGLGGRLYFYLWRHLRLGGMGGVLRRHFGTHDSKYESGGGGITIEGSLGFGRSEFSLGIIIGGGRIAIYEFSAPQSDGRFLVSRRSHSHFLLAPLATYEFQLNSKLKAKAAVQYNHAALYDHLIGHTVQFYVGILFGR